MDSFKELVDEQRKIKWVVRHGKKVKKIQCPSGYKVVNGQCKKMTGSELLKRKRAAKKAARKRRSKIRQILRKRMISLKRRKAMGLK